MHRHLLFAAYGCLALLSREAAAAENAFENVKAVPPPGIAIPDTDRVELEKGASELGKQIESLHADSASKARTAGFVALMPKFITKWWIRLCGILNLQDQ